MLSNKEILQAIKNKLENSPVLNGGFEKLQVRVEKLDLLTTETADKVNLISDKLFNPEKGVIVGLKEIKTETKFELKPIIEFNKRIKKIFWISISGLLLPIMVEALKYFLSHRV